eukprot:scaffold5096_cov169-Amphora_coffeaeformis.AAC.14
MEKITNIDPLETKSSEKFMTQNKTPLVCVDVPGNIQYTPRCVSYSTLTNNNVQLPAANDDEDDEEDEVSLLKQQIATLKLRQTILVSQHEAK